MASTEEEVSVDGTHSKLEVDSVLYTVNLYSTKNNLTKAQGISTVPFPGTRLPSRPILPPSN